MESDIDAALEHLTDYIMSFPENEGTDREVMQAWILKVLGPEGVTGVCQAWAHNLTGPE